MARRLPEMRVTWFGDEAVLVEGVPHDLRHALVVAKRPGWLREIVCVGSEAMLYLQVSPRIREDLFCRETLYAMICAWLNDTKQGKTVTAMRSAKTHVCTVRYGGADTDLDEVAQRVGLSAPDVIALHVKPTYIVDAAGFVPGFAYLKGLLQTLHLPRKAVPRAQVFSGAVAIAAGYTGIYLQPARGGGGLWECLSILRPLHCGSGTLNLPRFWNLATAWCFAQPTRSKVGRL
ncbi:carboxyltransferase domain-containing protein [Ferroacidibacillus organovorans]|uniref:Carboxyltransferase domain-containing protein n=1 Tax=Ferroacidibacillus organovorans TaxID=1765683 RepID=A0A101XQ05_9BACL|nr:carboxyltransferase domain-containing protein [Ferroacidibacillus organovorans]KUO95442.1 hypothetical protein ATW55_02985 [Ferroacidibacillus organovorans]